MHDPNTVAFEIKNPFVRVKTGHYRPSLVTIWHRDPDKGGDDDSCGRFIRSHHIDPAIIEQVRREFAFNFEHNYWFSNIGLPKFSTMGTVLQMYQSALWQILLYQHPNQFDKASRIRDRFMRRYLVDILHFAENPTDSLFASINLMYGEERAEVRIEHFVSVVTADIFRKRRPWYKHPNWHVHHWRIQFHPFQQLKRRYWDKCSVCGKRGFKGPAMSDWDGTRRWHQECDTSRKEPTTY